MGKLEWLTFSTKYRLNDNDIISSRQGRIQDYGKGGLGDFTMS